MLNRQSLHLQVAELLRRDIQAKHQPGDRLGAESALAKHYGVSLLTFREALSALAQEGLLSREHGRGTFVTKPTEQRHIAILSELDLSQRHISAYFLRVAAHLPTFFARHALESRLYMGHTPMGGLAPEKPSCPQFMEAVTANRVAGVAVLTMKPSPVWQQPLQRRHIPVVGDQNFPSGVTIDYADMVQQGVRYLAESGCRRPAMIGYGPLLKCDLGESLFLDAARAAGMQPRPTASVFSFEHGVDGDTPMAQFNKFWLCPPKQRPDGMLVLDDMIFQQLLPVFLFHRIDLSRELRVITHMNRGAFDLTGMPVASLELDPETVAEALAGILVRQLRTPQAGPERIIMQAKLRSPQAAAMAA